MIRKGAGSLANEDGLVQAETGGHPQAILVRGPEVPGGRWQPPGSPPPITAKLLGHLLPARQNDDGEDTVHDDGT